MPETHTVLEVSLDPQPLWHAAVLAAVLGAEHGRTDSERDFVTLVIEPTSVTMIADWDVATTTTTDGQRRPARFRFQLPVKSLAAEREWVSCRVRVMDLIKRLRGKVENSEQYGPLQEPVRLEAIKSAEGERIDEIILTPQGMASRRLEAFAGMARGDIEDMVPMVPTTRVGVLGADILLDVGAVASEAVGVLLDPGSATTPCFVAGVGAQGSVISAFTASPADLFEDRAPVVMSARLARMAGWMQESMLHVAKADAKARVNEQNLKVVSALVASVLDVDSEVSAGLTRLYRALGGGEAKRVAEGIEREQSVADKAAMAAGILFKSVPEERVQDLAKGLERIGGKKNAVLAQMVREDAGMGVSGDLAVGYLGLAGMENQTAAAEALACVIGEQKVVGAARARLGERGLTTTDIAQTAVELDFKTTSAALEGILKTLEPDKLEVWWGAFEAQAQALGVDARVMTDVRGKWTKSHARGQLPQAAWAKVGEGVRAAWSRDVDMTHEGIVHVNNGRVTFGWNEGVHGALTISDVAVNPDVTQYPLTRQEAISLLGGQGVPWSMEVYSADLSMTMHRVVGFGPSRQHRGKVAGTVAIAHWAESDNGEPDTTPQTVWAAGKELTVARHPKDFPVARAATAGVLHIIAVSRAGVLERHQVPMRAIQREAETETSFALDAEGLAELLAFVTAHERDVVLDVYPDGIRLSDGEGRSVSVVPRIGSGVMHERQAEVSAGFGVPATIPTGPLTRANREAARRFVIEKKAAAPNSGQATGLGSIIEAPDLVIEEGVAGATALAEAERRYRSVDREIQSVETILGHFPVFERKGEKAFVQKQGGIAGAVKALVGDPIVVGQLLKSTAREVFERLIRDVRESGLDVAPLPDETLDLFQGQGIASTGNFDKVWSEFVEAAKKVRRRLVRRQEDLLAARGIQTPVVRRAPGKATRAPTAQPELEGAIESSRVSPLLRTN